MTLTQEAPATWTEPDPIPLRGTVVVLPGRGESAAVYERFGRRVASDAYRVHVVSAPSESPEQAREQVLALLAGADPEKPRIVVGSDAGAAFAAHLAASGDLPDVSALVLAGLPTAAEAAPALGWDDELDARTTCPTHRNKISDGAVRKAQLFTDLPGAWFDPKTPSQISVPVLGIHGRDDVLSPLTSIRSWYEAVPTAELVSIAGARHDVLNDQSHRTVAATLVLFLERLRAGAPIAEAEALTR